eukprot:TRINITY_DN30807_c0_g1_i1.p1 TRINITY_DN30807_c0_g1~~TRINITY_DN30807_c0_g1_i1.p1  ORF type:complete len:492 (+),score=186.85 TRINITY_DN30807_c0_g1_i1:82-1557(+)
MDKQLNFAEELGYNGLLAGFFRAMWLKNVGRNSSVLESINLPHTIVYRFRKPTAWYFMSKDGTIKKKGKKKLTSETIAEELLKCVPSKSGVLAQYYVPKNDPDCPLECSYVRREDLRGFLQDTPPENGVLQCFIDPRFPDGKERNSSYTVAWTSRRVTIENCSSRYLLSDQSVGLAERLDMRNPLVIHAMGNYSRRVITEAADRIAQHFQSLFPCKLLGLEMHFKVDGQNRLWFLYGSNVRGILDDTKRVVEVTLTDNSGERAGLLSGVAQEPKKKGRSENSPRYIDPLTGTFTSTTGKATTCCLCQMKKERKDIGRLRRKNVLFSLHVLDHFTASETCGTEFDEKTLFECGDRLPNCVRMIDPEMTVDRFHQVKGDAWLNGTVQCCSGCVDHLIRLTSTINVEHDGKIKQPFPLHRLPSAASTRATPSPYPAEEAASPPSSSTPTLPPLGKSPLRGAAMSETSYALSSIPSELSHLQQHHAGRAANLYAH